MGLCQSGEEHDKEKASKSRKIDDELWEYQRERMKIVKLLLLGTSTTVTELL